MTEDFEDTFQREMTNLMKDAVKQRKEMGDTITTTDDEADHIRQGGFAMLEDLTNSEPGDVEKELTREMNKRIDKLEEEDPQG